MATETKYRVVVDDDEMLLLLQCLDHAEKFAQAEKAARCRKLYYKLETTFEGRD